MNRKTSCLLLTPVLVLMAACGAGTANQVPPALPNADIYVSGLIVSTNGQYGATLVPAYWKNGALVTLSSASGTSTAVEVVANNVHVVGNQLGDGVDLATDWVNKNPVLLTDGTLGTDAYAAATDETNVFVAGVSYASTGSPSTAIYWENGNVVHLPDVTGYAEATGIAVFDGHIYVTGAEQTSGDDTQEYAVFWADGVEKVLPGSGSDSITTAVAVDSATGDLYIAGQECVADSTTNCTAVYWKNGMETELPNGQSTAGITIGGGHTYITGTGCPTSCGATLWTDGVPSLYSGSTPSAPGDPSAYQIATVGNDVLTAGDLQTSTNYSQGGFWLNNYFFPVNAPGGHPGVSAIAVVPLGASSSQ